MFKIYFIKGNVIEYDQNKIYSFCGFNEMPPAEIVDESDKYNVRRYSEEMSREKFLSTLNLEKVIYVGIDIFGFETF
jgi:hypothetical protein